MTDPNAGLEYKKNLENRKKRVYGYDDMKMMTIMFHFLRYLSWMVVCRGARCDVDLENREYM